MSLCKNCVQQYQKRTVLLYSSTGVGVLSVLSSTRRGQYSSTGVGVLSVLSSTIRGQFCCTVAQELACCLYSAVPEEDSSAVQ
jgi:hypothetical protein